MQSKQDYHPKQWRNRARTAVSLLLKFSEIATEKIPANATNSQPERVER